MRAYTRHDTHRILSYILDSIESLRNHADFVGAPDVADIFTQIDEFASRVREHEGAPLDPGNAEPISLVKFLNERVDQYKRWNPPQLRSCELHVDPEPVGTVCCNRLWLERVLEIVVINAGVELSEYQKPDSLICLTSTEAEGRCDIIVTDNGRGFSPKFLSAFAEEGVLPESATRSRRGLGLLMARVILNVYDGKLFLGESPEGGASVTLRF